MRSWTTFVIFGVILVAVVIFANLSKVSTANHPVIRASQAFFRAIDKNDAAALKRLCDPAAVTIAKAANNIINVNFAAAHPMDGPFANQPPISWNYADLQGLQVDLNAKPNVLDKTGLATVTMTNGGSIFLRRINGDWKVYYLTAEPAKQ